MRCFSISALLGITGPVNIFGFQASSHKHPPQLSSPLHLAARTDACALARARAPCPSPRPCPIPHPRQCPSPRTCTHANAYPQETSDMVRKALTGDYAGAKALHYKLLPLMQLIFAEGNPAGVKALLELRGICGPHVRLPLVAASDGLSERIKAAMW